MKNTKDEKISPGYGTCNISECQEEKRRQNESDNPRNKSRKLVELKDSSL